MWPDQVSNPGPLIYESGALLTALHGPTLGLIGHWFKVNGNTFMFYCHSSVTSCLISMDNKAILKWGPLFEKRICSWREQPKKS